MNKKSLQEQYIFLLTVTKYIGLAEAENINIKQSMRF